MTSLLPTEQPLSALPISALPTEDDLPETDHQPVDNELHVLVPILLRAILAMAWAERIDWFMGVNLTLYFDPKQPSIGPDSFLSLGVERIRQGGKLRRSYVAWEEQVMPQWVLEVVSMTPGGEYERDRKRKDELGKLIRYAQMGVLYYTIYNPDYWKRDRHNPFEVYRLIDGTYVRQVGNPVWMPELGLGIGTGQGTHEGCTREWLYWYDQQGNRYPAAADVIQQERQLRAKLEEQLRQEQQLRVQEQQRAERAEWERDQERQKLQRLIEQLKALDIDPDRLM